LAGAIFLRAAVIAGETGAVRGHVPLRGAVVPIALEKYAGKISGKVEAPPRPVAGVWLEAPDLHAQPGPKSVTVEQRGYQFCNGLLVVPVGARVAFPNLDPDYHNVFSLSKAKRFDLGRYKPDEKPAPVVTFDKAGVVRLFCEIHEHMRGAVIVVDSPHFTRTGEDGSFTLTGVAPGAYTLKAWVDDKRTWQQPITITGNRTLEVNLPAQ
jgi:plastocyanin